MTSEETIDLLEHGRQLHAMVRRYYDGAGAQCESPRAKLLLSFLSEHEKAMAETIAKYVQVANQGLLHAWFRSDSYKKSISKLRELTARAVCGDDEIMQQVVAIYDIYEGFYREAASAATAQSLQAAFENLAAMITANKKRLVNALDQMRDL